MKDQASMSIGLNMVRGKQGSGQRRTDIQGKRIIPFQCRKTIASMTTANMSNSKHEQQQWQLQQLFVMTLKPGRKRRAGSMTAYWLGRLVSKLDSVLDLINDALL